MNLNRVSGVFPRLAFRMQGLPKLMTKTTATRTFLKTVPISTRAFSSKPIKAQKASETSLKKLIAMMSGLLIGPQKNENEKEEVELSGKVTDKKLQELGKKTNHLTLTNGRFSRSQVVEEIQKIAPNIDYLTLDRFELHNEDFQALIQAYPLKKLEIRSCPLITQKSFRHIADTQKDLHTLLVGDSYAMDRETLLYLGAKSSLEEIIFVDCVHESFPEAWDMQSINPGIKITIRNSGKKTVQIQDDLNIFSD